MNCDASSPLQHILVSTLLCVRKFPCKFSLNFLHLILNQCPLIFGISILGQKKTLTIYLSLPHIILYMSNRSSFSLWHTWENNPNLKVWSYPTGSKPCLFRQFPFHDLVTRLREDYILSLGLFLINNALLLFCTVLHHFKLVTYWVILALHVPFTATRNHSVRESHCSLCQYT